MMKKFLINIFIFSTPFIIAFGITKQYYTQSGGDLNRIGKIPFKINYRDIFKKELAHPIKYTILNSFENKKYTADILIIGDSFSANTNYGYQNYLSETFSIINIKLLNQQNPFATLEKLIQSPTINQLDISYILLEIAERFFTKNINAPTHIKNIDLNKKPNKKIQPPIQKYEFKLTNIIKFPILSTLYKFNNKAWISPAIKLHLSKPCFSSRKTDLIILKEDISSIKNNTPSRVQAANKRLNILAKILAKKHIKLVVLPATDKYDAYSPFILNNPYPSNPFFNKLKLLQTDYILINSKHHLQQAINQNQLDVYWADDTHWSPKGSKIIANAIKIKLKKKDNRNKNTL